MMAAITAKAGHPGILLEITANGIRRKTYCLIDTCSNRSFICADLAQELKLKGEEMSMTVSSMVGTTKIPVEEIKNVTLLPIEGGRPAVIRRVLTKDLGIHPEQVTCREDVLKYPHLQKIAHKLPSYDPTIKPGILVGTDCPVLQRRLKEVRGGPNEPFAALSVVGWYIVGNCGLEDEQGCSANKALVTTNKQVSKIVLPVQTDSKGVLKIMPKELEHLLTIDYQVPEPERCEMSREDRRFLEVMQASLKQMESGRYEVDLPLREKVKLPDSKLHALHRLEGMKRRFLKDPVFCDKYCQQMNRLLELGYSEVVTPEMRQQEKKTEPFFLPHFAVISKTKEGADPRVVFDAAAKVNGTCLNDALISGPDQTVNLVGLLLRSRRFKYAYCADIKSFFYQVRVTPKHRSRLHYWWYPEGDITKEPIEHRLAVHAFGCTSSPAVCTYALRKHAENCRGDFADDIIDGVSSTFYVDDQLVSRESEKELIDHAQGTVELLRRGGFPLVGFLSSSKKLLRTLPPELLAKGLKDFELEQSLPEGKILGLRWDPERDVFRYNISLPQKAFTKRGVLSVVASVYDCMGFIASYTIIGRKLLQEICRLGTSWDEPLGPELQGHWSKWVSGLKDLEQLEIPRCFKPSGFGTIVETELHSFCDASTKAICTTHYIRLINAEGKIHCALLFAKTKVAPLRSVTVPRLELQSAVLNCQVAAFLKEHLHMEGVRHFYWTDSSCVLAYLRNESSRFRTYVANRIEQIRQASKVDEWYYVKSSSNPSDRGTRGMSTRDLLDLQSPWFRGPDFLWSSEPYWHKPCEVKGELPQDDPELKKGAVADVHTMKVKGTWPSLGERLKRYSSWTRAVTTVATLRRCVRRWKGSASSVEGSSTAPPDTGPLTAAERRAAMEEIVRQTQEECFGEEMKLIRTGHGLAKTSPLFRLDPFIDAGGLLRVGGRLQNIDWVSPDEIHPIILPRAKVNHIALLILRHLHEQVAHGGRFLTHGQLRSQGFFMIAASTEIKRLIHQCITCTKARGRPSQPKMASLPPERLRRVPPFSACGTDYSGAFFIKQGRTTVKRYIVVFVCLVTKATHIEVAYSLDTSAFIMAFRRFVSVRGHCNYLRLDNSTTHHGAQSELGRALSEMDLDKVRKDLGRDHLCEVVHFNYNCPYASNWGGLFERTIGTIRRPLEQMLKNQPGRRLDDEMFLTLLKEIESLINHKPYNLEQLSEESGISPLAPINFLTQKSRVLLPPPGKFSKDDLWGKRWRSVQYLVNDYWTRFRKEQLQLLQTRTKWQRPVVNLERDDIVLVSSPQAARGDWQMGRIERAYVGDQDQVRMVDIALGNLDIKSKKQTLITRPVSKVIPLIRAKDETNIA